MVTVREHERQNQPRGPPLHTHPPSAISLGIPEDLWLADSHILAEAFVLVV